MTNHRMLDYIHEQPEAVANTLRVTRDSLSALQDVIARQRPENLIVAGLGSSYTAAQMASPLLRRFSPIPTWVTVATEIGVDLGLSLGPRTLAVLVSRSGERGGIVDALRAAKQSGATCVAVTAIESSLLASEADLVIVTGEGAESVYPKTKSVMASAAALMQLGLTLDTSDTEERRRVEGALAQLPDLIAQGIGDADRDFEKLASWLPQHKSVLVTGMAGNQGVALEAALKLQEAAGVTAEWDETGSALHGAVCILDPTWLFVGLVTRGDYVLDLPVLRLARHFGANRLCVAEPGLALDGIEAVIRVPEAAHPLVAPLLFLPPVHLLTHHLAVARGLNPDEPAFADFMLEAMLPPGRQEPDWRTPVGNAGAASDS